MDPYEQDMNLCNLSFVSQIWLCVFFSRRVCDLDRKGEVLNNIFFSFKHRFYEVIYLLRLLKHDCIGINIS